jgi:hypothetical protein
MVRCKNRSAAARFGFCRLFCGAAIADHRPGTTRIGSKGLADD